MKKIIAIVLLLAFCLCLCGCRQADRVAYNVSKEADNFNVTRRLVVINARSDELIFELVGRFSITNNSANELAIICETGPNEYKKHFVYLNEWTLYFVEDIGGAEVSTYQYEVNFLPQMLIDPVDITFND